ncbi:MAG: Uma2 family endonuclease [Moorea sp. SIO4G2]|uniref:Uma2 family endonuclease n=1 Tax=unclassified Moorena TaxID=2683338 RepID=UPI0013FC4499|nr:MULTISPECIES: Uma2 family endonuclease [unclassified Moorena]NEO13354.1 Uma2 family endonuclease [Moorena sp. SIO3E8]NEO63087.1 Uma2 family endonuclease [Moorena sp. SIO4G2]NEP99646.1 Uma2 family endonuclease [Moorena sp. SIO3F7]
MSLAKPSFKKVILPHPAKETLPTMYDLPSEDPEEPGLPDEFHIWQPQLCSETFRPPNYDSERVFVASDLNLYYDPNHTAWYKRPDWFAVVGISRFYQGRELRMSYVIWQEEVRPIVAIELLSASTRDQDLGYSERTAEPPTKWEVYEQILAIPYYVTFDRVSDELRIFKLDGGSYQPQTIDNSKFWIPELQLGIGLWLGQYRGLNRLWLRWYDQHGNWIPTEAERTELERQRAEQERQQKELAQQRAELAQQRAELAQQRAQQLAERLRQMGINPDEI